MSTPHARPESDPTPLGTAATPSELPTTPPDGFSSHRPLVPVLAFALLAVTIVASGSLLFKRLEKSALAVIHGQVEAVGVLKSKQINDWLLERKRDLDVYSASPLFMESVDRWVATGGDGEAQSIRQWLISLRDVYHYQGICLLDPEGRVRVAVGSPAEFSPPQRDLVAKAIRARTTVFSDFHWSESGHRRAEIDIAAPLFVSTARGAKAAAVIYVCIDPARELDPLVQSWPTPSSSAETLLVRKEGAQVLFLNELRHRKGTALTLRLPLAAPELPAARAARGGRGIFRGLDYRGVPCIAFLTTVPGTSWYLVSKVDEAEVLAPLHRQQRWISVIALLLISAAAGVAFFWWRQQKSRLLASYYKSELERRSLAVRFHDLFRHANDAVLLLNEAGTIVDANERATKIYGYQRQQLIGLFIGELLAEAGPQPEPLRGQSCQGEGALFETVHRRNDGVLMPVEVSVSDIALAGAVFQQRIIRDISERKEAERALRESLIKARQFFEQPLVGMAIIAPDRSWLEVNDNLCLMLGWAPEELAKTTLDQVTHPEDRAACAVLFGTLLHGLDGYDTDQRLLRRDGETIWTSVAIRPVRHRDGNADYLVASFKDVTKMKRAEEALRASRDKLAALFSASPVPIVATTLEGIVTEWNPAASAVFGWSAAEAVGNLLPFVPEQKRSESLELLHQVRLGLSISRNEVVRRTKAGSALVAAVSIAPLRGADGSITGAMSVMEDITEQKRAERILMENEQRYRLLSVQFHALLDALPDSIFLLNRENRVLWTSATARKLYGEAPGLLEGKLCFHIRHGRSVACTGCPAGRAFSSGNLETGSVTTEDGKILELRAVPILNAQGEVESVVEIARDVTERVRVEEHLRHAQKMDAIGTLAGGIAHDFNNILTVIMGYAEVLNMKLPGDAPWRKQVTRIISASERAAALTKGLLAYSRKSAPTELATKDLNEIIRNAESFLSRTIEEEIRTTQALSKGPLFILADDGQIEQVLMNLVINSRDALPEGGEIVIGTGEVAIDDAFIASHGFGRCGRFAALSVSDTGMGMGKETIARIFEPFFTTKEVGKGTGLGLSIVFGIVKRHEGFINVSSLPGRGTTFTVYLPLTNQMAGCAAPAPDQVATAGSETILVVEDNDLIRALLMDLLTGEGYRVLEAADGEEGVRVFREQREAVQLLLLDVVMPRKNGRETFEEIRSIDSNVKAIFMSGYPDEVITRKGIDAEGLLLVAKPIAPAVLLAKIRSVLDRH